MYQELAKHGSKNRPVSKMETKTIEYVNKSQYRKMMLEKLIPAIEDRFHNLIIPTGFYNKISNFIFKRSMFKPLNRQETNAFDLGIFNIIQSLQYLSGPTILRNGLVPPLPLLMI